jgi:hypothetical protein
MAEEGSSKVFDAILNNLRELERNFNLLISQIQNIRDSSSLTGDAAETFESAKKRLSIIQKEISGLAESIPASDAKTSSVPNVLGPPLIIRCKNWEDFKLNASSAENISFLCREEEKIFQVDAVKGSRIYTYSGQLPMGSVLLKIWLSKELGTDTSRVLEGILTIG